METVLLQVQLIDRENTNTQHIANTKDQRFYIQTPAKKIIADPSLNGQVSNAIRLSYIYRLTFCGY